jgi:hypothetical protein
MQGGGDIVNLQINIANSANPPQHYDYSVSAVYDSGSSLITTRYEPIIGELSSFFHSTFIFIMPPYYGIIIVIFIILGLILSVVAYRPFIRMIIRQKFVRTVRKDLLEARSILKNNSCPDVCTIPCTADWSNEKRKWLERKRNNHQNDHIPENETKRKHKKPNIINRHPHNYL